MTATSFAELLINKGRHAVPWTAGVVALGLVIWLGSHWGAQPGTRLDVLWGLTSYHKNVSPRADPESLMIRFASTTDSLRAARDTVTNLRNELASEIFRRVAAEEQLATALRVLGPQEPEKWKVAEGPNDSFEGNWGVNVSGGLFDCETTSGGAWTRGKCRVVARGTDIAIIRTGIQSAVNAPVYNCAFVGSRTPTRIETEGFCTNNRNRDWQLNASVQR